MQYVEPNLKRYDSLKSLLDSTEPFFLFDESLSIKEVINMKNAFIISEPGYGKTRLLKELLLKSGHKGIFIDLKKVGKKPLDKYIKSSLPYIKEIKGFKDIDDIGFFKTKDFQLKNDDKIIFCLDALDEVKQENFSYVVDNLKIFFNKYSKANFFTSCRKNYLDKWQHIFSELNFNFVELYPLKDEQINNILLKSKIPDDQIKELLGRVSFYNRKSIIGTPRYLKMVIDLVKESGIESVMNISRKDLFDRFIYQKLDIESAKDTSSACNKEITKKILEKLALVMEIYQTNQITKDELMEFFDDIKSNLNIGFLNQVSLDSFYARTLLKDNIDTVEFGNTEFQEYLAAKEILRLGKVDQVIFDLSVVKELKEIHPSWINTLSFLVEFDISLLKNILTYVFSNTDNIHINNHLNLITKYNVDKLDVSDKCSIFKMVFSYFQNNSHWMSYDIVENLSFYYDKSLNEYIKNTLEKGSTETNYVLESNAITMVAFLLERNFLTTKEKDFWKDRIKKIINTKGQHEVVLRKSVFALGKFKEINLYKNNLINNILNTDEDTIISNLIYALEDINPNHKISCDCFIGAIKKNSVSADLALDYVDDINSIKYILNKLVKDKELLSKFIDRETSYHRKDKNFTKNIGCVIDGQIYGLVKKIIINSFDEHLWYKGERSSFVKELTIIAHNYSSNLIFDILKILKKTSDKVKMFSFRSIFALILEKKDVKRFIDFVNTLDDNPKWIIIQIMQKIKYSDRKNKNEVYEEGRKYLKDEYEEQEKVQNNYDDQQKGENKQVYDEFIHRLEPEKGMFIGNVFSYYNHNKEKMKDFIKDDDKKRLKKLVEESILDKFDPGQQKLTTNVDVNGLKSFTTNQWIFIFGDCLKIAKDLNMDITLYRQKILNYIPFAYDEHREIIFDLIPLLTKQEVNNLIKLYNSRDDDLINFLPSSTIDFYRRYKIIQMMPVIKSFVNLSEVLSIYDRRSALLSLSEVGDVKKTYFKDIFKKYKNIKGSQMLSNTANEILISKFEDESAIKWRFNQIKKRAFPFVTPKGGHSVCSRENELSNKGFAKPLMNIKKIEYKKDFLALLEESFKILKKGEEYTEYTSYVWSIIIEYYKNLKEERRFDVLKDIERFIVKNNKEKGNNWFSSRYQELKFEYIIYIGKPLNMSDCIKKYNKFKENIYKDIVTPRDLVELVRKIIKSDLKKWVEEEGAYKYINEKIPKKYGKFRREDLMQKTIKTQFENYLFKHGLRKEEIHIERESQLLDDKRTDFIISYGFVGSILIEIKLTNNNEITSEKSRIAYKRKLVQYVNGTNSQFGIFVIFQIDDKNTIDNFLPILNNLYKDESNIEVIGLDCTKY